MVTLVVIFKAESSWKHLHFLENSKLWVKEIQSRKKGCGNCKLLIALTLSTCVLGANASEGTEESVKETVSDNEIIKTLLIHEAKPSSSIDQAPVVNSKPPESGSDTSESEDAKRSGGAGMKAAGSSFEREERETEGPILMVAGQPRSYGEVSENPELVSLMTKEEREAYIKVGQEIFQSVFE